MLAVYARVLLLFQRRRARRRGLRDGHSGCVTLIQRFGGGLNLNVDFHTLLLDGVFTDGEGGALRFRPLHHIEDPAAVRAILDSLAASAERADRARPPDTLEPATLATQV